MERFIWEFDNHNSKELAQVVLEADSEGNYSLFLSVGGDKKQLVDSWRDQWGVFLGVPGCEMVVAQEDQTRSFIDALQSGLVQLRRMVEFETKPATRVQEPTHA